MENPELKFQPVSVANKLPSISADPFHRIRIIPFQYTFITDQPNEKK